MNQEAGPAPPGAQSFAKVQLGNHDPRAPPLGAIRKPFGDY